MTWANEAAEKSEELPDILDASDEIKMLGEHRVVYTTWEMDKMGNYTSYLFTSYFSNPELAD
jgi:hypothetical protein